jgi:uncharacterized protein (DUF1499 family)/uncharacterized membrane protein YhaH (DUF805 family)
MTSPRSRIGRVSTWLGRLCVLAVVVGPVIAHFELVAPLIGFGVFGVGLLLGLLCLLFGLVALALGPAGTRSASGGGMLPAVLVILAVYVASGAGQNPPRINDITTDTVNPPLFVHAQTLPENAGRDMAYPGAEFARQQQEGYGEIAPLTLPLPADETFKRVAAAARSTPGWVITREDPGARALEGYDTSQLFRFKDDFVIEVRDANGQSVVEMRSKSRNGKGDVGVNAKRIRTFLGGLKG